MRIDKPTCKYGEQNCRKRFDGNCTVVNDFELRCPIKRTINEVLEIIDGVKSDVNNGYMFDMVDEIKNRVLALKGELE